MSTAAYDGLNSPERLDRSVPVRQAVKPRPFMPQISQTRRNLAGMGATTESELLSMLNEQRAPAVDLDEILRGRDELLAAIEPGIDSAAATSLKRSTLKMLSRTDLPTFNGSLTLQGPGGQKKRLTVRKVPSRLQTQLDVLKQATGGY